MFSQFSWRSLRNQSKSCLMVFIKEYVHKWQKYFLLDSWAYISEVIVSLLGPSNTEKGYVRGSMLPGGNETSLCNIWENQVLGGRYHIYRKGDKLNTITVKQLSMTMTSILTCNCFSQHCLTRSLIIDRSNSQAILSLWDQVIEFSRGHASIHFQLWNNYSCLLDITATTNKQQKDEGIRYLKANTFFGVNIPHLQVCSFQKQWNVTVISVLLWSKNVNFPVSGMNKGFACFLYSRVSISGALKITSS